MMPEIANPLINGKVISVDTPIKTYLASKGGENNESIILSRSDLCEIASCPHKWRNGSEGEPDKRSPSLEFGSLFDCLLLQPGRFDEYYVMAPTEYVNSKKETALWTWKSSKCRDWRDEQEAAGFMACSSDDLIDATSARKALLEHPEMGEQTKRLLANSQKQVFVIAEYHDDATGLVVPVKCLTDIVPNDDDPEFSKCLFDLKTAKSAAPRPWKVALYDNDYHVQAAINIDCHQATGSDRTDFRHLIVENVAPWEPARRFVPSEFLTLGRMKYLAALRTYCQCVSTGVWPSYTDSRALRLADGYESADPLPYMVGE